MPDPIAAAIEADREARRLAEAFLTCPGVPQ